MSENFERLQKADPARELDQLSKARIKAAIKMKKSSSQSLLKYVAAITLFAVTGTIGIGIGRASENQNFTVMSADEGAPTRQDASSSSSKVDSMYFGFGRILIQTDPQIKGDAGTANGYIFVNSSVKREVLVKAVAEIIGATGPVSAQEQSLFIGSIDGSSPNATVDAESLINFYGYNSRKSPWDCVNSAGSSTGAEGKPDTRVCDSNEFTLPSRGFAIQELKRVVELLGIDINIDGAVIEEQEKSLYVSINLVIEGSKISMQRLGFNLSSKGIYGINGFAAPTEKISGYEIVSAKDAAERTLDARWSNLGPIYISGNEVVAYSESASPRTGGLSGSTLEGKPMVEAMIETKVATSATLELGVFYNQGQTLILPMWVFTDKEGSKWGVLAVANKYVKFTSN
jgi:hypothetical protein